VKLLLILSTFFASGLEIGRPVKTDCELAILSMTAWLTQRKLGTFAKQLPVGGNEVAVFVADAELEIEDGLLHVVAIRHDAVGPHAVAVDDLPVAQASVHEAERDAGIGSGDGSGTSERYNEGDCDLHLECLLACGLFGADFSQLVVFRSGGVARKGYFVDGTGEVLN
jgi:hypothetical protein